MRALISPAGQVSGLAHPDYTPEQGWHSLPLPDGYTDADFDLLVYVDGKVTIDAAAALLRAKTARIAQIKIEAAERIAATDWKLQRAKEQEDAGWVPLATVDAVLVEREAIRRSSNTAEVAVNAMTDPAEVAAFKWDIDVSLVESPRRLTHTEAFKLFTDEELETIRTAPPLATWWAKFTMADYASLSDPAFADGVLALEQFGVLAPGRVAQVLAGEAP